MSTRESENPALRAEAEARIAANLEHTQKLKVLLAGKMPAGASAKSAPQPTGSPAAGAPAATATSSLRRPALPESVALPAAGGRVAPQAAVPAAAARAPMPAVRPAPMAVPRAVGVSPGPQSKPAPQPKPVPQPQPRPAPQPPPKLAPQPKPTAAVGTAGPSVARAPVAADVAAGTGAPKLEATQKLPGARRLHVARETLQAAGYLPGAELERQFADYYRRIKRPLIARATAAQAAGEGGVSPRVIMLASALPGDGKTFTSLNLALSIARERDLSVLLVDADVAKPHVSRILAVEQEPGLLDALGSESADPESFVLQTDIPGLAVLPAGQQHERATELLASQRMTAVVNALERHDPRRIVLFDSPPLLVSSESRALSAFAGQVVLVVCAGRTPHAAVLNALSQFPEGKQINLVLNQGLTTLTDDYFSCGGYGAYGSYGSGAGQSVPQP